MKHFLPKTEKLPRHKVFLRGTSLEDAEAVMILMHGRGSTADEILTLGEELDRPGWTYLAPQAPGNIWYPYSFLQSLASNEPALSSSLGLISETLADVNRMGIPPERTILLGFSQGACLTLEYAARNPLPYGGIVGLSGGLIGPEGTPREYPGSLSGTAVFLGCSDVDSHIPKARVQLSRDVFKRMGADVTERLYPNMGHTINEDEITFIRALMKMIETSTGSPR
jgi:phospholipase/carboxylesterase